MKLLIVFFFCFIFLGCMRKSTTTNEKSEIITAIINEEVRIPLNETSRFLVNDKYRLYNDYNDTLYLSNSMYKIIPDVEEKTIADHYRLNYLKNKNVDFNTSKFSLIKRINNFDNKSLPSISFSLPINYKNYYLINLEYHDWSSGKLIFYVLKQTPTHEFEITLRDIIRVN